MSGMVLFPSGSSIFVLKEISSEGKKRSAGPGKKDRLLLWEKSGEKTWPAAGAKQNRRGGRKVSSPYREGDYLEKNRTDSNRNAKKQARYNRPEYWF